MLRLFALVPSLLLVSFSAATVSSEPLESACQSQSCRPITCVLVSVCLSDKGHYLPYLPAEETRSGASANTAVLVIKALN